MALKRTKGVGQFAPLSHTYYLDDAVMAVGERAEVLFTRILAFSSGADADGFLTLRQVEAIAIGLRGSLKSRLEPLLQHGLLEEVTGGLVIRSWLKWNKSTEEIGRHLKNDRERKAGQHALF